MEPRITITRHANNSRIDASCGSFWKKRSVTLQSAASDHSSFNDLGRLLVDSTKPAWEGAAFFEFIASGRAVKTGTVMFHRRKDRQEFLRIARQFLAPNYHSPE